MPKHNNRISNLTEQELMKFPKSTLALTIVKLKHRFAEQNRRIVKLAKAVDELAYSKS
jgi:hypothetical protein